MIPTRTPADLEFLAGGMNAKIEDSTLAAKTGLLRRDELKTPPRGSGVDRRLVPRIGLVRPARLRSAPPAHELAVGNETRHRAAIAADADTFPSFHLIQEIAELIGHFGNASFDHARNIRCFDFRQLHLDAIGRRRFDLGVTHKFPRVHQLMTCEICPPDSGLFGLWNFNDGTANDSSTNGSHAKFVGNFKVVETQLPGPPPRWSERQSPELLSLEP